MNGDQSKRMPPAEMAESLSLSVRNRYWHTRIAEQEKELERMRPVYDAAMAWSKARKDYDNGPTSLLGVGLELAEDRLLDACSQAEEGE